MGTNSKNPVFVFFVSFIFLLCSSAQFCYGVDTIRQGQTVADGDTLVSEDEAFELGFFSPENSTFRFVGIWYKVDVKAVVWVANRDSPISNRNGVLRIGVDGNLVVLNGNRTGLVWSSNVSGLSNNTAAILQNTGNLVLSNNESIGDTSRAHWQSFEEPTDTFLPGMRVPVSSAIGEFRVFRSWKSASDPSPGNYTMGVDPKGGPQIIIWDRLARRWRSGQWNSVIFTGIPNMSNIASFLYGFKLSQPDENRTQYFTYDPSGPSDLLRFRLGWDGREQQLRWDDDQKTWTVLQTQPDAGNLCDLYNHCGDHAVCDNSKAPKCTCLDGFRPRVPDQWSRGHWSGGCERRVQLQCQRTNGTNTTTAQNGEQDGFKGIRRVKLPDSSRLSLSAMNVDACASRCLGNCSCSAYAFVSGIGCMIWEGDLVDLQHLDQAGNLQFFYRIHNFELDGGRKISNTVIIIISVLGACLLVVSIWLLWRYKKKVKGLPVVSSMPCCRDDDVAVSNESKTKDFSADLSGPTDVLIDGSQVNGPELMIVNFSCSIEGEEKMLIYEYLPNKSLDYFLFDESKRALLDWRTRIFGGNQNEANTVRVVGTYGYMSPEYAMEGLFSVKSDVYSFGDSAMHRPTMAAVVLMLESEAPALPMPKQPTYTSMRSLVDADYSMDIHETASASSKDVTVTMVDGR
ncbi:hypothetical protein V6N12_019623 [Hibiscus sabdariffa]|uniref:non-specific serine/threonine protein kinase n=1 Tax=Hibiscus sabdariffa TaxID=183260 RepID=A0ABR2B4U5_9ROSI